MKEELGTKPRFKEVVSIWIGIEQVPKQEFGGKNWLLARIAMLGEVNIRGLCVSF